MDRHGARARRGHPHDLGGSKLVPGRAQNAFECLYEFLSDFGVSIAGPAARPYIPLFVAFFILILFSNWSGLVPPVGRVEQLRAPTSDVNITIGLALVSFVYFEYPGLPPPRRRRLPRQVLPVLRVPERHRRPACIALFVGLVELMLEFVKPVTLSMRLFGNIYGGEVALGVITALTIAFVPVGLLGLEVMLNAIQALIFSVLTLMFILLAIESHHARGGSRRRGGDRRRPHGAARGSSSRPTERVTASPRSQIDPRRHARGVGGSHDMEYIGAGLAALGVIGPGIGIGILGGLAASAIGRNPDAAGQIRGIAIILAAFAEGLGVLAIVVGLLAIFIQPA